MERWEDALYRQSYKAILQGRWREHDPWDVGKRESLGPSIDTGFDRRWTTCMYDSITARCEYEPV